MSLRRVNWTEFQHLGLHVCLAQLLSQNVMADESPTGEASGLDIPVTEVDEVVELKDNVHMGPFQMEILKERAARKPAYLTHVMIAPLRHTEIESRKAHPPLPELQVLHTPHSQLVVRMS